MDIFWFVVMTTTFMAIICNNVKLIVDPYAAKRMNGKETLSLAVGHIIAYVLFYFGLTNFIGHMVARF